MNRREFIATAAAGAALALPLASLGKIRNKGDKLRIGIIGTGARGQVHLEELLKRDDVVVTAICDIEQYMLDRALKQIADAGKPKPRVFTGSGHAYEQMLARGKLDGVHICTPWEWHAPMAIAAMQEKIAVGCEVVAGITLDDHWKVLRTQQETGTPYMLLENVCYRRDVMAVMNMVRRGLFGELVHLQGGYQHDLRAVKLNGGTPDTMYGGGCEFNAQGWSESRWRTQHAVARNGELYPSHGIGPIAMNIDIHRGNRFTRIGSFATKSRGLRNHIVDTCGPEHPNAKVRFALGDVVTTQIACENGETILLQHDTSLPRPYSLGFRVQGTEGLWMDVNESIYLEGKSPKPHQWEPAQPWLDKYDHPLWQKYAKAAEGAGHGGMDFFVVHAFIEALKRNEPMPIDIYDAVAWSAITPLSEQSIAEGNKTLDFPDFTDGKWATRKPIFALDDRY
ncbi:Gfo/Idh/MocA family oxidoreductase [Lysobacter sp. CFH 32150]|uniref:Gfo/Idh/MocA family protein n=1 Tax=Lysobacter sp. CFH 32150 TaxID=2927128 RepID=UPI001FA7A851|nr:Gfo/Idh/MocA family oxidoreductase [Lysobacter sp. CFH 32150]MCI4568362.1 Gfo/Idh/MocA family oxidoreductase [Lysobacter sp. CFH 32150]